MGKATATVLVVLAAVLLVLVRLLVLMLVVLMLAAPSSIGRWPTFKRTGDGRHVLGREGLVVRSDLLARATPLGTEVDHYESVRPRCLHHVLKTRHSFGVLLAVVVVVVVVVVVTAAAAVAARRRDDGRHGDSCSILLTTGGPSSPSNPSMPPRPTRNQLGVAMPVRTVVVVLALAPALAHSIAVSKVDRVIISAGRADWCDASLKP